MAAASGNSTCAVGIAPDATLSACRVVADVGSDSALALANSDFSFLYKNMTNMHVSSNSYGIPGCKTVLSPPNRRLQSSACPFNSTNQASPCSSNSACANVTWTSNPNPSTDCDKAIAYYCQFFFDDPACTSFLDFFATCEFNGQDPEQLKALMIGTTNGRKGKGIVYVFAAGNDFVDGSNVNFEGSLNSRFTIAVGAVDKHGMHASYSTGGAPLFVSAPGGDFDFYTNNIVALAGGGCTDATEGTSFATPIVSGIVALMLQINPELAWRDVQGVLASTSRQIQPNDPSWSTNAAGFHHSYLYGFGLIDASAAVKASETWQSYSAEIHIPAQSGSVDLTIADYPGNPVVSTVTVVANATFVTESAIVYLDLSHPSRGDLEISLTSPAGTVSILSPGRRPENSQVEERWKLMTVRNWGESASGQWTLQIADKRKGDVSSCVDLANWTIPSLTLDCSIVNQLGWCVNGTQSSLFSQKFPLLTISDPSLADGSGQTPADACCACGGGVSASTIKDLFRSWRLDVYGHDQTSGPQSMPTTSSPTSGSGSATAAPQAQSTAAPVRVRQAGSTTTAPRAQPPAAPLTSPLQPVATFPISTPRSGAAHTMFDRVQTSILLFLGMASIRFVF